MLQIPALEKLVHELSRLPGVGPKTAQRLAYFILRSPTAFSEGLAQSLIHVQSEVHTCPSCYNYTDSDICKFCSDVHRNNESLCIVEEPLDILRIEGSGAFRGRYHVLHGAISPLEGISPQDLKLQELFQKIEASFQNPETAIKEVILALDADLEGDTTVLYIAKHLQGKPIRITRIAHGVPIGSDLDFVDDRTMGRALENRVQL